MANNWNNKVAENDLVYMLGDIALCCSVDWICDLLKKLNGEKVLILGNHDSRLKRYSLFQNQFQSINKQYIIEYANQNILLTHWKSTMIDRSIQANFYCHNHSKTNEYKVENVIYYNVGVDANKFAPVEINEIHAW